MDNDMNWYKIAKDQDYIDSLVTFDQEESEGAFKNVLNQLLEKSKSEQEKEQEKEDPNQSHFDFISEQDKEVKMKKEENEDELTWNFFEKYTESTNNVLSEFTNAPEGSIQPWTLIPYKRIIKIWNDAAKQGFVRDIKGMDAIAQQMIDTTLKLSSNTLLMGHTQQSPDEEFEDYGITTEEQKEKFYDYAVDENGQMRISDYGMDHLEKLAKQLYSTNAPEQQMLIVDKMLNIVHQRSDLASWFIEGGFTSLNELAGNPYNDTNFTNVTNVAKNKNSWYKTSQQTQQTQKQLYIMRGLSGSGKSTLAEELVQGGVILSTDDYFMVNGQYVHDEDDKGESHAWNRDRVEKAMQKQITPIVADNTNAREWEMKPYVELALKYGYEVDFKEPNTPWKFDKEELFKRNTHGVPLDVIQEQIDNWDHDVNVEGILKSEKPF